MYFIICFVPIRCVHKGFHCKTLLRCLVLTNILFNISAMICARCFMYKNLYWLFLIVVYLHYLISNEKHMLFHLICIFLYLSLLIFNCDFQIYFIVSIVLNIILMIGGRYSEKVSSAKII